MLKIKRHRNKERYCSLENLFGGGGGGGREGAGVEQGFNQQAIEELRRLLQPFVSAGTAALPGALEEATPGGLDKRLSQIFNTDIFGKLVGERESAVRGQLAAGGLTRSGTAIQEAANIPTDIGLALENLLSGRSTDLARIGLSAAGGLGGGIAGLLSQSGQAGSAGLLVDAQGRAAGQQNLLNLAGAFGGAAVGAGGVGPLISGFFSDVRLKENIEQISVIGDLPLYQWDWCDFTKDTIINVCPTLGFLSEEVKENYPEFVFEFGGFEGIDYAGLLDKLELNATSNSDIREISTEEFIEIQERQTQSRETA